MYTHTNIYIHLCFGIKANKMHHVYIRYLFSDLLLDLTTSVGTFIKFRTGHMYGTSKIMRLYIQEVSLKINTPLSYNYTMCILIVLIPKINI